MCKLNFSEISFAAKKRLTTPSTGQRIVTLCMKGNIAQTNKPSDLQMDRYPITQLYINQFQQPFSYRPPHRKSIDCNGRSDPQAKIKIDSVQKLQIRPLSQKGKSVRRREWKKKKER